MKKIIPAAVFLLFPCLIFANPRNITAPAEIAKTIASIPVTDKDFGYKNIGERMENIGMKISSVRVDLVGKADAEPPIYKAGDHVITITTNQPNEAVRAICPILGNPEYIKRGKKYIPNNLTAHWLMSNRCDAH